MTEAPKSVEVFEEAVTVDIFSKSGSSKWKIGTATGIKIGVLFNGIEFSKKVVLPVWERVAKFRDGETVPAKKPFFPARIEIAKWNQRRIARSLQK